MLSKIKICIALALAAAGGVQAIRPSGGGTRTGRPSGGGTRTGDVLANQNARDAAARIRQTRQTNQQTATG